jgi:hypothetical protein
MAAALSGLLHATAGWTVVNIAALPLLGIVIATALWMRAREGRTAAAPAE